jgi:hypothetical protein
MDAPKEQRILLQETEWTRLYRTGDASLLHESKFAADGIQVSAASLRERWDQLSTSEKLDFAGAFAGKPSLTKEDEEIVRFLMQIGSESIIAVISPLLPRLSDRDGAVSLLLERPAAQGGGYAAPLYQALEQIGDARAIPFLRRRYQEYRTGLLPLESRTIRELLDYSGCVDALWRLDRSQEYRDAVQELLSHPDEDVRSHAQFRISENSLQDVMPRSGARPQLGAPPEMLLETRWSRVYWADSGLCWRVSKFREGLRVPPGLIQSEWPGWTLQERIEFAESFCQSPSFSAEDSTLLAFLIEQDLEYVRTAAAIHLRNHADREAILATARRHLDASTGPLGRYYHFLRCMGDRAAVPLLEKHHRRYRDNLEPFDHRSLKTSATTLAVFAHSCP